MVELANRPSYQDVGLKPQSSADIRPEVKQMVDEFTAWSRNQDWTKRPDAEDPDAEDLRRFLAQRKQQDQEAATGMTTANPVVPDVRKQPKDGENDSTSTSGSTDIFTTLDSSQIDQVEDSASKNGDQAGLAGRYKATDFAKDAAGKASDEVVAPVTIDDMKSATISDLEPRQGGIRFVKPQDTDTNELKGLTTSDFFTKNPDAQLNEADLLKRFHLQHEILEQQSKEIATLKDRDTLWETRIQDTLREQAKGFQDILEQSKKTFADTLATSLAEARAEHSKALAEVQGRADALQKRLDDITVVKDTVGVTEAGGDTTTKQNETIEEIDRTDQPIPEVQSALSRIPDNTQLLPKAAATPLTAGSSFYPRELYPYAAVPLFSSPFNDLASWFDLSLPTLHPFDVSNMLLGPSRGLPMRRRALDDSMLGLSTLRSGLSPYGSRAGWNIPDTTMKAMITADKELMRVLSESSDPDTVKLVEVSVDDGLVEGRGTRKVDSESGSKMLTRVFKLREKGSSETVQYILNTVQNPTLSAGTATETVL